MLESTDDTSTTGGYCGQIRAGRWFLSASLLISGRCIWLVVWKIFSHSVGNNHPNWLIFFRGVETTNQISIQRNFTPGWDIPSYLAVQCTSKWDDRVETHVFPFVPIYIVFVLCHDFFFRFTTCRNQIPSSLVGGSIAMLTWIDGGCLYRTRPPRYLSWDITGWILWFMVSRTSLHGVYL